MNNEQPMLPEMPADPELENHVPNVAHVFVREVTEENIPLIAKESGKTEVELTAMLMARREMQGENATLRVRYLALNYHNHKPVNHRDGKPRWCDTCGLTGEGLTPESKVRAQPAESEGPFKTFTYHCEEPGCFYSVSTDTQELLTVRTDIHMHQHLHNTVEVTE